MQNCLGGAIGDYWEAETEDLETQAEYLERMETLQRGLGSGELSGEDYTHLLTPTHPEGDLEILEYPTAVPAPEVPGFCYLAYVLEEEWPDVAEELGPYPLLPDVDELLLWMLENEVEEALRITRQQAYDNWLVDSMAGKNCHHVQEEDGSYSIRVGSAKVDVEEARRLHRGEMAKMEAQISFNNDYASIPKTNIRLTTAETNVFSRWAGFEIISTMRRHCNNDHKLLAVAREMLDQELDRTFPHNTDGLAHLHVGATIKDHSLWNSHLGHDFLFSLVESKDMSRMFEDLARLVRGKLVGARLPALTSKAGNTTRIQINGVREAFTALAKGGRQRLHLDLPVGQQYDVLHFRDSIYDIDSAAWDKLWVTTGAKTGYATVFFPDCMVDSTAVDSAQYFYEEYYPQVEDVEWFVDTMWPSVLALSPLVPMEGFLLAFRKLLGWLVSSGWRGFVAWLKNLAASPFGPELAAANLFDVLKLGPILEHFLGKLRPVIRENFARVRVNWRGGFSNGYDHAYGNWRRWLVTRRHKLTNGRYLDVEMVSRVGEMYLLKFYLSSAESPITYTIGLPENRRTVQLADIETAWNPATQTLGNFKYFRILEQDWLELLNWALGEPVESLDVHVVVHTLTKIRGGFALGSNVLVEAMGVDRMQVTKVAVVCLLEAYRRSNVLEAIAADKELRSNYESNIKRWLKLIGKVGMSLATGGLALPVYFLYKWLFESNPAYEFVKYAGEVRAHTIRPRTTRKDHIAAKERLIGGSFSVVVPHQGAGPDTTCPFCALQLRGMFSATGTPDDGQQFICGHVDNNSHNVGFLRDEMPGLLNQIRDAETFHGQAKVTREIVKAKHYAEANMAGIEHQAEIWHFKGGPGTGKTETIKSLMAHYESLGVSCLYLSPISKLLEDMIQAKVMGRTGRFDFQADTTWYWPQRSNVEVLFVDECTAIRWDIVRLACCYLGVKRLMVFGDAKQTCLAPERGEGYDITNARANVDWEKVSTHELVKNFRMGRWRVNWYNEKYGYRMVSVDDRLDPPEFMTIAAYGKRTESVEREIVFSHASAPEAFGKESVPGDQNLENLSVRSSQGKTYQSAAVAYTLTDVRTAEVHGMLNVANSRSRDAPLFLVHSLQDPHVLELQEVLGVHSKQEIDRIAALPQSMPERPRPKPLSPADVALNDWVSLKAKAGFVKIDKPPEVEDTLLVDEVAVGPLVDDQEPQEDMLEEFFRKQFHFCLPDALLSAQPTLRRRVLEYLASVYANDKMMGRSGSWNPLHWLSQPVLVLADHRRYLDFPHFAEHFRDCFNYILTEGGGPRILSSTAKGKIVPSLPVMSFSYCENHVEFRDPWLVRIRVEGLEQPQEFQSHTIVDGDFACRVGKRIVKSTTQLAVGNLRQTTPRVWDRKFERFATQRAPVISNWEAAASGPHPLEKAPVHNQKLRLGKDSFRMLSFIDKSEAYTRQSAVNEAGGVQGVTRETNVKLQISGFLWDKTKAGKLKRRRDRVFRSFNPGLGNHFNNTPEETLIAAQRIGRLGPKPKLTHESRSFAEKMAEEMFRDYYQPVVAEDPDEYARRINEAIRVAGTRNYHKRAQQEWDKKQGLALTCSNKDQFKPLKGGKLNLFKPGQALLQSPSSINLEWIAWNRIQGWRRKTHAGTELFLDDYENVSDFRRRLSSAIRALPQSVQIGIADGEEWDSQQNEVTVHAEKHLCKLFGASDLDVEAYYQVRGNLKFIMHGVFSGRTNGEKGSGFLDTKRGNSDLQAMVSHQLFRGVGPKVVAVKGDDYLRAQSGLEKVPHAEAVVRAKTGMVVQAVIGQGGEFCGNACSRAGVFPSVVRATLKASAIKSTSYQQFCAQQQSWRDTIQEYRDCGLEEMVASTAYAEGFSVNFVSACLEILNSLSHLNRAQWEEFTTVRVNPRYCLNGATGPKLIN